MEDSRGMNYNRKYIVYDGTLMTEKELEDSFARFPEEIQWGDYAGAPCEYIYQGVQQGKLVPIEANGVLESDKIYSPSEYADRIKCSEISDDISIADFDTLIADSLGLWNYPLSEYEEVKENDGKVVIVRFNEGYRLVEV